MNKPYTVIVGFEGFRSYLYQKLARWANASIVAVTDIDPAVRFVVESELLGHDFTQDDQLELLFETTQLPPDMWEMIRIDFSSEARAHLDTEFPAYRTSRHLELDWIDPTSAKLDLYARKQIHVKPTFKLFEEEKDDTDDTEDIPRIGSHPRIIYSPARRTYVIPDNPATRARRDYQPPEFDSAGDSPESDGYYACIDGIIQACVPELEPIDCTKRATRGFYPNYTKAR